MTTWEYCMLKGVCGMKTSYPALYHMTANGPERVADFKNRPKGIDESQAVAQMISQLGEDGWELAFGQHIGDSTLASPYDYMWFKRPKS